MKRTAILLWNLAVIGFIALAVMALQGKIRGQFDAVERLSPGRVRDWTEAMGFIGLGLLAGVVSSAVAVSSPFWGRVPRWGRILLGLMYAVLVGGAILVAQAERRYIGSASYPDYVIFLGCVGLFLLPPVLAGSGMPYLVWKRIAPRLTQNRSSGETAG